MQLLEEGFLAVKLPSPRNTFLNLCNEIDRFRNIILNAFKGYYFSGNDAYIHEDGYVFITQRVDGVTNVAGQRLCAEIWKN